MNVRQPFQWPGRMARGATAWVSLARSCAAVILLTLTTAAPPAAAAISFVQTTPKFNSASAASIQSSAFGANPVVGNRIVVIAWSYNNGSAPTLSASDSRGNTYTSRAQRSVFQSGAGNQNVAILDAPVATTGASFRVTVTSAAGGSQIEAVALEYSGISAVDQANTATGTTSTPTISTTAATTTINDLVVTGLGILLPSPVFTSISPAAGYAQRAVQLDNSANTGGSGADRLVSSTGVQSNTWTLVPSTGSWNWVTAIVAYSPSASSGPDHYELSLPTSSLACLPTTVTVTACSNSSSPCTSAATTLSGQTATLATSSATLGATSVTFNASGVATTTLTYPSASNGTTASVTLSGESTAATNARQCCPNGTSCSAASSCSTTFNTAGFIVSASANGTAATIPSQTAGTASGTYVLRAVQTSTTTKACEAALTGATTVNWAAQCNNPTTCSVGNLMSVTGNSATAVAGNPNSGVSSFTSVPMTFDANGNAPFSFNYSDVGQVTLHASKSAGGSLLSALTGASNAFVVKPAGFTVTAIRQTASPNLVNPAAVSAAGAKFVKAGEGFSATVTAVTSGGAATPNFGRETSPEGVLLTRALVLPSGGATGALGNGSIAGGSFSSGVATVTNLSFSEVGIITLTPSVADSDYLGAGNVTGTPTGNVGRFVPAQFALSASAVTHRAALSCSPASAFTYLGENFRLGFTLTAQNVAGGTTTNYSASFAKFDPTVATAFNLAGRDASTVFTTASGRLSLGTASGTWSNGVAGAMALTANASRAATPDGPFNAAFGIAPVDSDGVAMAAFDMASASGGSNDRITVANVPLRFGRLRLANAVGSQTRALALPITAQSWTGSAFDTNALDSCTSVPATAVSFGNLRRTLTVADTSVSGASVALSAGAGRLILAAPLAGRYGSADVALSLGASAADASCLQPWAPGLGDAATAGANLDFLRGAWCASSYDKDPSARATWGLYRGADAVLYQRENY